MSSGLAELLTNDGKRHTSSENPSDYAMPMSITTGTVFDDLDIFAYYEKPEDINSGWALPLLERRGNDGVDYIWQIGYQSGILYRLNGTYNAPKVDPRQVEIKSGESLGDQAWINATSYYNNKTHDGYIMVGSTESPMKKGMKGEKYKKGKLKRFPVYVSYKLNGSRLLVQIDQDIQFRSYLNRRYFHLEYVEAEMEKLRKFLPENCTLDGEMYIHGRPLKDIVGIVKTVERKHPELHLVVYYIFDIIMEPNMPYEFRYNKLIEIYQNYSKEYGTPKNFSVVQNYIANSEDEVYQFKDKFVKMGFEGAIIRKISHGAEKGSKDYEMSLHKPGRSTRIYKLKDFIDEEGIVIDVKSAKGKETGLAMLVIRDKFGLDTVIRHGEEKDRREWMNDPSLVLGKKFTFKHVGRNEDTNRPNQPTGIGFRDYE